MVGGSLDGAGEQGGDVLRDLVALDALVAQNAFRGQKVRVGALQSRGDVFVVDGQHQMMAGGCLDHLLVALFILLVALLHKAGLYACGAPFFEACK